MQRILCTLIRFKKDPFSKRSVLGCPHVSYVNPETPFTRTWIDPGKRASVWKPRPLTTVFYVDRDGFAQIASFLLVSFTCRCRSSGLLHVLVPRRRSVCSLWIMEAGDKRKPKQKETKAKDPTFVWEDDEVELPPKITALPMARIHPPFCFRRQLPVSNWSWPF